MAESTLSLKKRDFEIKLGMYFGHGSGGFAFEDREWTTKEAYKIRDCVESGLRQFYFPPPLGGVPYDWSFLKPTASLAVVDGDQSINLPDDFGGFEGRITISSPTTRTWQPIPLFNEGIIRELYSKNPERTGPPEAAAVRPIKGTTLSEGTRSQLMIFPEADESYTLQFPYYILANCLDGTHPYAYGGMAHAETILESCLAIAEQRYDNTVGVHSAKFMERLAASIALDRRLKPEAGGLNTDNTDRFVYRHDIEATVTYNGAAMG